LVKKELTRLRDFKLGKMQLHLAKQQFISRIVMAEESRTNLMLALGNSLFDYGRIDTLSEIVQRIEVVTAEELQDIAREIFDPTQLSQLQYIPKN
jgi:predicted Zn-dependent peptidase